VSVDRPAWVRAGTDEYERRMVGFCERELLGV